MATNPIVIIILLAMAIGLVVGFEVGQHVARKRIHAGLNEVINSFKEARNEERQEREKKLEELRTAAQKLQDDFLKIVNAHPEVGLYANKAVMEERLKQAIEKEQRKNGNQSKGTSQTDS